jgi:hypothetical protein
MSDKILPNGRKSIRPLLVKLAVILIPSYSVAFLTEAMVYTIPMLAATSFLATNLYASPVVSRRVDDEEGSEGSDSENSDSAEAIDFLGTN